MEGDWKAAKAIFDKNKELIRYSINGNNETTLHMAVSRRKTMFVENLMTLMEEKDLELQDNNSYTALCIAVTAGDVQMAKILVRKNKALRDTPTTQGMMPIQMAASFGKQDMTKFLYDSQSMRVSCRHEDIFSLLYEVGSTKDCILTLEDKNGNMLHLAGILTKKARRNHYKKKRLNDEWKIVTIRGKFVTKPV
ncbi:ankyrin repeat-containing protein [Tanacetum coccineum]